MSGDTIQCANGIAHRMVKNSVRSGSDYSYYSIAMNPIVRTGHPTTTRFCISLHNMVLHALDKDNNVFDCPQKFAAYRGYICSGGGFVRPRDYRDEVPTTTTFPTTTTITTMINRLKKCSRLMAPAHLRSPRPMATTCVVN